MYRFVLPDIPREKISCEQKDLQTAYILKKAFVGAHGELNSAFKFVCHFYYWRRRQKHQEAEVMFKVATQEIKHFIQLGELIISLGVDPIYMDYPPVNFYAFREVNSSCSCKKSIAECVSTKLTAINCYQKILEKINNKQTENVIKKIQKEEQHHLFMLEELLKQR